MLKCLAYIAQKIDDFSPNKLFWSCIFCIHKLIIMYLYLQNKKRPSYLLSLHNTTQATFLAFISQTTLSLFPKHTQVFIMLVFPLDITFPLMPASQNSIYPLKNNQMPFLPWGLILILKYVFCFSILLHFLNIYLMEFIIFRS